MKRIIAHLQSFSKQDWEIIGYFVLIAGMLLLIPIVLFWDYIHRPDIQWYWITFRYSLTKFLQNLHVIGIDISG
jgi:hypothetical protein